MSCCHSYQYKENSKLINDYDSRQYCSDNKLGCLIALLRYQYKYGINIKIIFKTYREKKYVAKTVYVSCSLKLCLRNLDILISITYVTEFFLNFLFNPIPSRGGRICPFYHILRYKTFKTHRKTSWLFLNMEFKWICKKKINSLLGVHLSDPLENVKIYFSKIDIETFESDTIFFIAESFYKLKFVMSDISIQNFSFTIFDHS